MQSWSDCFGSELRTASSDKLESRRATERDLGLASGQDYLVRVRVFLCLVFFQSYCIFLETNAASFLGLLMPILHQPFSLCLIACSSWSCLG